MDFFFAKYKFRQIFQEAIRTNYIVFLKNWSHSKFVIYSSHGQTQKSRMPSRSPYDYRATSANDQTMDDGTNYEHHRSFFYFSGYADIFNRRQKQK